MKKVIGVIFLFIAVLIGKVLGHEIAAFFRPKSNTRSRAYLASVAAKVKQTLPISVSNGMELFDVEGLEGVLVYDYRFVNAISPDFDSNSFITQLRPNVLNAACMTSQTRDDLLKNGIVLKYKYFDKDKNLLSSFEVTPEDCGLNSGESVSDSRIWGSKSKSVQGAPAPLGLMWGMSQKEMWAVCKSDRNDSANAYMPEDIEESVTRFVSKTPLMPEGADVILLEFYKDQLWKIAVMGKKHNILLSGGLAKKQLAGMERTIAEKYKVFPAEDGRVKFADGKDLVRGDTTLLQESEGNLKVENWMIRYAYMPIVSLMDANRIIRQEKAKKETNKAL